MNPILELKGITKRFGENQVLSSVNLQVRSGEIHGLVGENGAGKSTLLKILLGSPEIWESGGYMGQIMVNGEKVAISSPQKAAGLGIGMVHQEFALIPDMSIAENIMIGQENTKAFSSHLFGDDLAWIDWKHSNDRSREIMGCLGIDIDTRQKAGLLSVSVKQFVELAREISRDQVRLLVLDEPTASLSEPDAVRLLEAVRKAASRGIGAILVSHRLEEITACCQRITVLRDGKVAASYDREEGDYSIPAIAQAMVGQSIDKVKAKSRNISGEPIMSFRNFSVFMPGEQLRDFDLDVYRGEILGLAGLVGHGKTAVGNGVMGICPVAGRIGLEDEELNPGDVKATLDRGVFFLHEERRRTGLLLDQSVADNIVFAALQRGDDFIKGFPLKSFKLADRLKINRYAEELVARLGIRCQGIRQPVRFLSGGNQQKICLARALALKPKVLIINEPTRGIDIGAKETILDELVKINREHGTTIICASSELGELRRIADRIIVMYEGRAFAQLSPQATDIEYGLSLAGKKLVSNGVG